MLKVCLFGAALALAATGAEAKAPQCHDAKGHVVPCPHARAPDPAPGSSDGAFVWLVAHGAIAPGTIL